MADDIEREILLEVAAQDLYFGDRNDPKLWEALRIAGGFETKDELGKRLQLQEMRRAIHKQARRMEGREYEGSGE